MLAACATQTCCVLLIRNQTSLKLLQAAHKGRLVKKCASPAQVAWRRIVLDEAHNIKDRACSTAKAVFALNSQYKWALSGTPLQNRVSASSSPLRLRLRFNILLCIRDVKLDLSAVLKMSCSTQCTPLQDRTIGNLLLRIIHRALAVDFA